MFLNDLGKPQILSQNITYGPYEQHDGPLLLSAAAFKEPVVVPSNWCRVVIGSLNQLRQFRAAQNNGSLQAYGQVTMKEAKPGKPLTLEEQPDKIELTLIPAGQSADGNEANVFLVQDDYVKALITDNLGSSLDFIPKAGEHLHKALHAGVDVMYIDDLPFEGAAQTPAKENVYTLLQLIRPRVVCGLRRTKLPKCLHDCCVPKNLRGDQS